MYRSREEKAKVMSNLMLFPQSDDTTARMLTQHRHGLEQAIAHFSEAMADPESPIRAIRKQEARPAQFADMPASVDSALVRSLHERGIHQLYTHQLEAFTIAESGRNVTIVTPTASGKTLCFNLPVLNKILANPNARAMYMFPTKALAEDQLHEFQAIVDAAGVPIKAFTYDGDTPQDARKAIRERANVVFTNPDMMHSGILPHHTKWAKAFENLEYIVIDELHYYRGVYGSHFGNLLRRLKRICAFYGSTPKFICCSATIANPRELAQALTGEEFELVDQNGAPSGEKYVVFYNPPVVNRQLGIRRSYLHETRRMALEFIDRELQTLVFANNRLATELLVTYLKDALERRHQSESVRGYRGGYLPRERREIERKLREGDIRAVVATNALELGIDIGSLDAVVMAGYPGTIASTWQRAGRAGRRHELSVAVLVASSAPLDQYIIEHPEYFFDRPPEHAHVNLDNLEIMLGHLKCAVFELPLRDGELFGTHNSSEMCKFLEEQRFVHHSAEAWHWTSDTYPADAVSLRSVSSDNFVVIDATGDHKVIADVSFSTALTTLHPKAIYLHEARQYHVEKFDYDGRKAYVKRVDCDYFTDAIDYTQVKELETFESHELPIEPRPSGSGTSASALAVHGEVRVNTQVVGFKKIKFYTLENVGAGHLSMPEQEMHTTSFWLHFPSAFLSKFGDLSSTDRQNAIAGLGNALRTVASLLLMCDPRDLGVSITENIAGGLEIYEPNLYLYDSYPGGIGLSAPLYRLTRPLLEGARDLLSKCSCDSGCPSCVGPVGEIGENGKQTAARILAELIAGA
jgi:DEAD/DEAH box helicase domain-containing protein